MSGCSVSSDACIQSPMLCPQTVLFLYMIHGVVGESPSLIISVSLSVSSQNAVCDWSASANVDLEGRKVTRRGQTSLYP